MKKAIFMFLDRVLMSLYGLLALYLVAANILKYPVDINNLAITFAVSSSIMISYIIVRGCNMTHKLESLDKS